MNDQYTSLRAMYARRRKAQIDSLTTKRGAGNGDSAQMALDLARVDIEKGAKPYYGAMPWKKAPGLGAWCDGNERWIEEPSAIGLRFVGYADEVNDSIRHRGWYSDESQHSKLRGVVYQLPGKDGKARFVGGYDDEDNRAANSGGPAYIDFEIYEDSGDDTWSAKMQAAWRADSMAEHQAEESREHDRAFIAGSMYADNLAEIENEREAIKSLLEKRRHARANSDEATFKAFSDMVRAQVSAALERMAELADECESLKSGDYYKGNSYLGFYTGDEGLRESFNYGAGIDVL